jgi:hypothetical protein
MACVYAWMEKAEDARGWLEKAITLDEKYREMACNDQDFNAIREDARFKVLVAEGE